MWTCQVMGTVPWAWEPWKQHTICSHRVVTIQWGRVDKRLPTGSWSGSLSPCHLMQPLTLPDAAPVDEDFHGEGGVGWLVAMQQEGIAAQGGHVGGEDHRSLQGEVP